jgi:hypothetical protein
MEIKNATELVVNLIRALLILDYRVHMLDATEILREEVIFAQIIIPLK